MNFYRGIQFEKGGDCVKDIKKLLAFFIGIVILVILTHPYENINDVFSVVESIVEFISITITTVFMLIKMYINIISSIIAGLL